MTMKKLIFLAVFLFCGMALFSCADQTFEELTTQEPVKGNPSGGDDHEDDPE